MIYSYCKRCNLESPGDTCTGCGKRAAVSAQMDQWSIAINPLMDGRVWRAALIALYAQYGLVKVLDGLKSCVEHGAPKLAYLRACLTDKPKKAPGKAVIAQQYEQRDYGSEQDDAMKRMLAMGGYSSA